MALRHEIYSCEVLEFSPRVSFIILLPPSPAICHQRSDAKLTYTADTQLNQETLRVPVKSFEVSHLHTYQPSFISSYTKAMLALDVEMTAALQAQREVDKYKSGLLPYALYLVRCSVLYVVRCVLCTPVYFFYNATVCAVDIIV